MQELSGLKYESFQLNTGVFKAQANSGLIVTLSCYEQSHSVTLVCGDVSAILVATLLSALPYSCLAAGEK